MKNRLYIRFIALLLLATIAFLTLKNMGDKAKFIQFLHDASEIKYRTGNGAEKNNLQLQLPVQKPPVEIVVLEVILK